MPTADLPPLPSEVEAVFAKARLTVADVAVLYRYLDHDPLCLSWPSSARMFLRRFIEREANRASPSRSW